MAVKVYITVIDGPDRGLTHEFAEGTMTIGRGKGELVLHDKKVSSRHCSLTIIDNDVYLEDFGSTNGTYVGGRKVEKRFQLHNLDEVVLGLTKISVAIVEQISKFKEAEEMTGTEVASPSGPHKQQEGSVATRVAETEAVQLPAADALYRTTGIHRIDNLIEKEMKDFSKWDDPGVKESHGGSAITPKIRIHLSIRKGPEGVTQFSCTKAATTIGRKDVDIRLNDLDCSRKHATIEIIGGHKAYVRDLASTNGTYVNGKKISYQEINSGDLVQVGQTVFEVTIESA